jgi:hypothetical protein
MSRGGHCKKHQWTCADRHTEWVQLKTESCEWCQKIYIEGENCNQCDLRKRQWACAEQHAICVQLKTEPCELCQKTYDER